MPNNLLINSTMLKEALGKAIDISVDSKAIQPFVDAAYNKYIAKAFGDAFCNWLAVDSNINNISNAGHREMHTSLRSSIRNSLAFYSYYEYASFSLGNATANGLVEQTSQTTAPARQWVHKARQAKAIEIASEILEQAIGEVLTYRTVFTQFYLAGSPDSFLKFINRSGADLGESVPATGGQHRLWLTLRPWLKKAQRDVIQLNIGADFLQGYLDRQLAGTLTTADLALQPYLQDAEGYNAYSLAFTSLVFKQLDAGGIRIYSDFDGIEHRDAPAPAQLLAIQRNVDQQALASISKLKSFLASNIEDYPQYANSAYYTPPSATSGILGNGSFKTIFGIN